MVTIKLGSVRLEAMITIFRYGKTTRPRPIFLNMDCRFRRLVEYINNFYMHISDTVIDIMLFSLNTVIAFFNLTAPLSLVWFFSRQTHPISHHFQIFFFCCP